MVTFKHKGNFDKTEKFLKRLLNKEQYKTLQKLAEKGVFALSNATPVDTGVTAASWSYEIVDTGREVQVIWSNSSVTKTGIPIVVLLQYGHGTGTGGYVKGRDFINPAIKPIFDEIEKEVWKEVTKP